MNGQKDFVNFVKSFQFATLYKTQDLQFFSLFPNICTYTENVRGIYL